MAKRDCQGWHASLMCRIATVGFLFCLGPPGLQADEPPDRGSGSPPPPPTVHRKTAPSSNGELTSGDLPPDLSQLSAQRTALNPLLVRDRRHRLLLTRGTMALRDGRSLDGISYLQALLDTAQDAFFWTDDGLQPRGARTDVIRRVQSSPDSVRRDYERLHGAVARDLLMRYSESRDARILVELIRRFGHTEAAREAAIQQLFLSHDTGREMQSHEWARFLKADPFHWNRLPSPVRTIVAQHLSDRASQDVSLVQWHQRDNSQVTHFVSHRPHNEISDETLTPYPIPLWTARLDANLSPAAIELKNGTSDVLDNAGADVAQIIRDSYDAWLTHRTDYNLPIASVNEAIVADDVLIVRDFTHVRAVSLPTGREQWKFACESSLAAVAGRSIEQPGRGHQGGVLDFHAHFSGNSVLGRLATDGRRVFVLDKCTLRSQGPDQLVALPVKRHSPKGPTTTDEEHLVAPLWTRGTLSGVEQDELAKHTFLGCPLCVDDRLYVLAEFEQQISLFTLEAATGRTIWKQGIALVEKPVADDSLRQRTACTPLYHNGLICCPTEVGIVVGVEALTGRLEWVYDHMDEEQRHNSGRWAFSNGRHADRSLLPNHTYLHHGRLLYLPSRSRDVHCLNAETGQVVWRQPRHDAHAIGGVTESSVLLLGNRKCIALNVADGHQRWQTSTPEPAGTGIVAGDRYLLPTTNGPCLSINTQDGQIEGQRFARLLHRLSVNHQTPAGNLLAHDNLIIATTPLTVHVYPQARHRLAQINAAASRGTLSPADRLLHAELLMTVGDPKSAGEVLQQLLSIDPPDDIRRHSEQLWREVLYSQLEESEDPFPTLHRLTAMARTDDERLRLQLSRLSVSLRCDDAAMLTDTLDEFQTLPSGSLISLNGEEDYIVSAEYCFRDRLATLQDDEQPLLSEAVATYMIRESRKLTQSMNAMRLERFVSLFADWPQTGHAQSLLAERWIATGRRQEAELLLLSRRNDDLSGTAEPVNRLLAGLYVDQGLMREAEQQRLKVSRHVASVPVWKHRLASLGRDTEALSLRLSKPVSHQPTDLLRTASASLTPTSTYQITEHGCIGTCSQGEQCSCQRARRLRDSDGLRRVFVPQLSGSIVVFDQGINKSKRTHSRLMLVDRDTGISQGQIDVPTAYWQLPRPTAVDTGHMMIISKEAVHGISLLEAKTMWSVVPETSGRKTENVKIGPIGSDYCVLQTSRELRVVHPANGRTLWKRTHLPPGIGLQGNESTGIIGDSQTLCVFNADQTSYTLYHTQSGRQIRQGTRRLASGANRRDRRAVGRRLVEVVTDATGCRLCIWDSHDDRLTNDIPLTERLVTPLPGEEDFACVTSDGRLQIVHAANGQLLLDVPLEERGMANAESSPSNLLVPSALIAFADRDRFYINLTTESDKTELSVTAPTDEFDVPHVRVRGRLLAIDRYDGRRLWDRTVPDACLPIQPEATPAVLTLISRTTDDRTNRNRAHNSTTTSLMVEVLDPTTGVTLARRGQLIRSRVVGYRCSSIPEVESAREGQGDKVTSRDSKSRSPHVSSSALNSKVASLIGLDSLIDIQVHSPDTGQPIRVAADDAITVDR